MQQVDFGQGIGSLPKALTLLQTVGDNVRLGNLVGFWALC